MELFSEAEEYDSENDFTKKHNKNIIKKTITTNNKKNNIIKNAIIVVDLDDTLIDKNNKAFPKMQYFLNEIFKNYKYVFLWTAGNKVHAEKFLYEYHNIAKKFSRIITGLIDNSKPCEYIKKYLINLKNAKIKVNDLPYILIDDSPKYFPICNYDININVTNYYKQRRKIFYIDYQNLLHDLHNKINIWYNKRNNNKRTNILKKKPKMAGNKKKYIYNKRKKIMDLNSDVEEVYDSDNTTTSEED